MQIRGRKMGGDGSRWRGKAIVQNCLAASPPLIVTTKGGQAQGAWSRPIYTRGCEKSHSSLFCLYIYWKGQNRVASEFHRFLDLNREAHSTEP